MKLKKRAKAVLSAVLAATILGAVPIGTSVSVSAASTSISYSFSGDEKIYQAMLRAQSDSQAPMQAHTTSIGLTTQRHLTATIPLTQ